MHEHAPPIACAVSFTWCNDCKCVHVGLFDEDQEMICMGNIGDIDLLISMLQQAKGMKKDWMLVGDGPQRMQ
jgi:hypothetical protein